MKVSRKEDWRDNLGALVNQLAVRMRASFERQLAPYGVSRTQWAILRDLYDGPRWPAQLAALVGCDRAVMTRLLELLERGGLIERKIALKDRRNIDVSLTPKGRDLTTKLIAAATAVNNEFMRGVSKQQAKVLIAVLKEILAQNAAEGTRVA